MKEIKQKAKDFIDEFHRTSFQKKDVIELLVCFANQETERLNRSYKERGNYILSLDKQLRNYTDNEVKLNRKVNEAKEIVKGLLHALKNEGSDYTFALESTHPILQQAEQFLKKE